MPVRPPSGRPTLPSGARWRALAAATAAAALLAGCSGGPPEPEVRHILALGDSLAVGVQPDENGTPEETPRGYADVIHRELYDTDSTLRLVKLGCGGEDTGTMLDGGRCDYVEEHGADSQIAAAEAFLAENAGAVELVVLDIGANNLVPCAVRDGELVAELDSECVDEGLAVAADDVEEIAGRLREAAGPDVRIVGMTYYNPFLAGWLLGGEERELAEESAELLPELNEALVAAYQRHGVEVADVAAAFDSEDFEPAPAADAEGVAAAAEGTPRNVARICSWTWMCAAAPQGPDIHANDEGYRRIADVFLEVIG
ncbi:SGNH/GDSL hydrolase family protein [Allonocardiopsis opalescens]|uniref:GDSL-like lipase/acylhydrolase family protein n=1 Tax=Allonocardiopsis opalescens TaxID=1144618 RepID=A0A2T0QD50_9ACTN|nr:SGNH/GDSL hydrolase family protein [Allonocardiopsis opalescens]PRY01822.1 GDSL-like lipase/acylhydrolase family protein [Allonocardiopsis opalescens]